MKELSASATGFAAATTTPRRGATAVAATTLTAAALAATALAATALAAATLAATTAAAATLQCATGSFTSDVLHVIPPRIARLQEQQQQQPSQNVQTERPRRYAKDLDTDVAETRSPADRSAKETKYFQ